MTDDLLARFERGEVAAGGFHHREHVEVAWHYLARLELTEALTRFSVGLRRLAAALGAIDKYHETITWAFMLLVNERRQRAPAGQSWTQFMEQNTDLLEWPSAILREYYAPEVLESAFAKRCFVLPGPRFGSSQVGAVSTTPSEP